MKKLGCVFCAITILLNIMPFTAYAWKSPIVFVVDGKIKEVNFDVPPIEKDGYLYMPLRPFAEVIDLYITWDESEQAAIFSDYLIMQIDSNTAKLMTGETIPLPDGCRLQLINARTLCPSEFVLNQFGYKSLYDEKRNIIYLSSDESFETPDIPIYTVFDLTLSDINGNSITNIPDSGKFFVNTEVQKNLTGNKNKDILIIATYDKYGALLDYNCMKGSFQTNQTLTFSSTITQDGSLYEIKDFVWDSLVGATPLSNNKSIIKDK